MTDYSRPHRRSSSASSTRNRVTQRRALAYELLEDRRLLVTWKSSVASGFWDVASNWVEGRVPGANDDVTIGSQSVSYRNSSGISTVKSVKTDGPFTVRGGSAWLKIAGAFNSTNSVTLDAGFLDAGQLTTTGLVTIENDGWLNIAGAFSSSKDIALTTKGWLDAGQLSTTGAITLGTGTRLKLTGATRTLHAGGGIELKSGSSTLIDAVVSATTSILISTSSALLENVSTNGQVNIASGVDVVIQDRLTLNTTLTLGTGSTLGFKGTTASLLGTGTVVLDNKVGNGLQLLDNGMTLTIGPGMTVRGGNTSNGTSHVGASATAEFTGTLRVEGKIIADPGMSILICDTSNPNRSARFANTLQVVNAGSLQAAGGTLVIAGKLTTADAAKVTQSSGGNINLVGQVDNTGQNWKFESGPWNLSGGKIVGGTITQTDTNRLIFTGEGGTLDGVQIDGNTTMPTGSSITVLGNLTYNGTLTLGQGAVLAFSSLVSGLLGNGTVVFDNKINNEIKATLAGMTLTFGPGITIRGGNSSSLQNSISRIHATAFPVTVRVDGTITVDSGGRSIAINLLNASSSLGATRLVNNGVLDAGAGTLYIDGQFTTKELGRVKRSNGSVNIIGTLDNTGDNLRFTADTGSWNLFGGHIKGGTITQSATVSQLEFTTKGGTLTNVRIDGESNMSADGRVAVLGDLTLTGGTFTLNDQSRIFFDDTKSSLLGNGNVFFADGTNALVARLSGMTLTIGKDITIRGGQMTASKSSTIGYANAFLFGTSANSGQNTNVVIEGKVIADLPGRQIDIIPANNLTNTGLLHANTGHLALGGFYTRESLGVVKNSGGVVKIEGRLSNENKTLRFDADSGSWTLSEGTIVGGTIVQGVNRLLFSSNGGNLNGVTITGDMSLESDDAKVNILNGLTLNGKATLGTGSKMIFVGDQTLNGRANIFLQNTRDNGIRLNGKNMELTIGPDVIINGGGGNVGIPAGIGDATIGTTSPTVILNGTITASTPLPSAIRVNIPGGKLVANGKLESQGGDLRISQAMTLPALGTILVPSDGSATFEGDLSFVGKDPEKIRLLGTNNFAGSASRTAPQLLEGLSQDLGPSSTGFSSANFLLGKLVVKNNTKLRLIDLVDNASDTKRDAVYVNSLIIEANADLNVGDLNLYYRSLTILGSGVSKGTITTGLGGAHQLVNGGGTLPFSLPTPGTIDATQKQHEWTFQGTKGGWVTLDASPAPGFWLRMRLFDASNRELKLVKSAAAGASVSISNFELPSSGIFRVIIDADPLHPDSVGSYLLTLTDTTPNRREVNIAIASNQVQGAEYGTAVEFTVTVTAKAPTAPNVTGSVQFKVDGEAIGGPVGLINGVAKLLLPRPKAGARSVTAEFISDNGNFDNSSSSFIQQITKKVLTIKANDVLQRVAGTAFTLQFTAVGFVTGEDSQVLAGTPVLSVDSAATNSVGNYVINITVGTLAATNYSFQFTTGTMTVVPSLPFRMDTLSGGDQKVIVNRALPLLHRLKVMDEFRNPIPNATVVFAAPTSGSSGSFAGGQTSVSVNTSALGEAQAIAFTVNDVPGTFFITATCNGVVSRFQVTIEAAGAPLEFVPLSGAINETAGTVKFSLKRNTTITSSLTVNLTSNHPEFIQLPSSTVTFPINVDTVEFDARIVNDLIASGLIGSGPKDIEILAEATGLPSTVLQVQVIDDDVATLSLQLSPTIQEGDKGVATLSRNTPTDVELAVRLTSGDNGILNAPAVITIPAGQRSFIFDVQTVADQLAFGTRTTSLTAEATGMTSARMDVSVIDIDSPALTLEPINSADISEKDGSTTFRLRRNSPPTSSLAVGISSSLPNSVDFLRTVVIPDNLLFVDFTVTSINDALAGSDRNLTITATAGPLSTTSSMTIREDDSPVLLVTLDSKSLAEGSNGRITVTLNRNTALLPALPVEIEASSPRDVVVSNPVNFIADSSTATFTISVIDDSELEGTHSFKLTARAMGFADAVSEIVTIEDNETLSLSAAASAISEKAGQTLFTVTRNITNTDKPLEVSLLSTDTTELTVPPFVTIPANATSATFLATAADDALLDGLQLAQIIASASGYVAGSHSSVEITVTDQESLSIQFDVDTIEEVNGKIIATIKRSNIDDLSQALTVTLENSADSRIHFQSNTIIIPVGEESVTMEGTAVDNKLYEGNKLVTFAAVAAGYEAGTASATVREDDHAWHNYRRALDVNNDGSVSPLDALLIIHRLNTLRGGFLQPQVGVVTFFDTNRDDQVSPVDALLVIDELNKRGSAEGEQAADAFFADYAADNWLELETRSRRSRSAAAIHN